MVKEEEEVRSLFKAVLIVAFATTLLFQFASPTRTDAITIFIDGMNTENTIKGMKHEAIGQREPYLIKSPLATELKVKDSKQVNIPWTGDISNIKEWNESAVEDLKNVIKVFKASPKTKDEPINIVSHSLGTVIATIALGELQNERPDIKINSLTTMGSPLGDQPGAIPSIIEKAGVQGSNGKEQLAQVLKQALPETKPLVNVNNWTNLWADNDNISGQIKIEGVKNIQIDRDKEAIKREALKESVIIPSTTAVSTPAIVMKPRIKSVDVWHEAYYKGVHEGEINWDIPKDYIADILPPKLEATVIAKKPTAEDETTKTLKERVKILKEEIKKAQTQIQSKRAYWDRVIEDFMKIAIMISGYITGGETIPTGIIIPEGFLPRGLQASIINTLDASQLSQRTAGDIPVTVNFQQSISGYYTQRPDYFGARGANWSATLSGTRTGAGSVPGSFTGSGSGRAEAFPGYFANTLNNKPLSLTTQGQVTASGKAGQPLTGTMTSTFNTTGIESVSLKGPVTLNPNGSLKWENFNGEVRHNGTQVGAMGGTVNQGPTK